MTESLNIISEFSGIILLTLASLLFLSWLVFFITVAKINKRLKSYKELITYTGGQNIEEIMLEYGKEIRSLKQGAEKIDDSVIEIVNDLKSHPRHLGILRFNAFSNTGSDLSFAIALLDDNDNGFVLSSIYGREESRIYAKPLKSGESVYQLTKEEEQAIKLAKDTKK